MYTVDETTGMTPTNVLLGLIGRLFSRKYGKLPSHQLGQKLSAVRALLGVEMRCCRRL